VHANRLGPDSQRPLQPYCKGYSEKNCKDARVTDNCQKKNPACVTRRFLLIAFGLGLGIPVSLAAGWVLHRQLYGLNPYDPILFATAAVVLGLFGLIATVVPALRASSISPAQALRTE